MNLKITGVSAERVQEISEEDAKSEGIVCLGNPVIAFSYLWNSINEKRGLGWEVNPLVWVYRFEMEMVISKLERQLLEILRQAGVMDWMTLRDLIDNRPGLWGRIKGEHLLLLAKDKGLVVAESRESDSQFKNFPNIQTIYRVADGVRV